MEVKVNTLKKLIPLVLFLFVISIISYNIYNEKRIEKMREIEMKKDIEEAINSEYESLLSEYNSIVEIIQDHNYSTDFRGKYLYKLNKLLDKPNRYTKDGWHYYDLRNFEEEFNNNKNEDKEILRRLAAQNVYKKIIGDE